MFISHRYKAIFVHIQRTGGNSIQNIFEAADPDLIETLAIDPAKQRTKHCYLSDIRAAVDEKTFGEYLKFCVVRNPFDRMLSWYTFFKDGANSEDAAIRAHRNAEDTELHTAPPGMTAHDPEEVAARFESIGERVRRKINEQADSFESFLRLPRDDADGLFERLYVTQAHYVTDAGTGKLAADRVLRFETLAQDFAQLAAELHFPITLPHLNRSSPKSPYQQHYTDSTRELVAQRFREDCELFDYRF